MIVLASESRTPPIQIPLKLLVCIVIVLLFEYSSPPQMADGIIVMKFTCSYCDGASVGIQDSSKLYYKIMLYVIGGHIRRCVLMISDLCFIHAESFSDSGKIS